ncbi:hypothetical protein ABZ690_28145 [Streptomyces sp. NPDC006967]|uniref:hypothetical protein n=1 Tax=Streptomyces sp. NPDC006967 TaxID=3156906 RepID=UPI0033E6207B
MTTRTTAAAACAAALLALTACTTTSSGDTDSQPAATVPDYTVVQQDDSGNQRSVTVEVDSTKSLRAVFDDVVKDLTDEAGYLIEINCSTGGTPSLDNRLANGNLAIGRIGAASTGLDDGETRFEPVDGQTCPATD